VGFDWDAENLSHIARHGITREEAEEAVLIEPLDADVQQHEGGERVLCFGRTQSDRLLTVLYTHRRGRTRAVTTHEMTRAQQRLYFGRE